MLSELLGRSKQRSSAASCFVGDVRNQNLIVMGGGSPAVNTTDKITLSAANPRFVPGDPPGEQAVPELSIAARRVPARGWRRGDQHVEDASYEVSMLTSAGWRRLNPIPTGNHRLYHSSHFLLDDGGVVSLGSNPSGHPHSETVLAFSPPYLYKGRRPEITAAPTVVERHSTIAVRTTGGAIRLAMTKAPSPTHGMDSGDGYMSFPIKNGKGRPVAGVGPLHAGRLLPHLGRQHPGRSLQGQLDLPLQPVGRGWRLPLLPMMRQDA